MSDVLGSSGWRLSGPDALAAAAVADEKHTVVRRPERRRIDAGAVGQALTIRAVGVDDPHVLLTLRLGCVGLAWIHDVANARRLPSGLHVGLTTARSS